MKPPGEKGDLVPRGNCKKAHLGRKRNGKGQKPEDTGLLANI